MSICKLVCCVTIRCVGSVVLLTKMGRQAFGYGLAYRVGCVWRFEIFKLSALAPLTRDKPFLLGDKAATTYVYKEEILLIDETVVNVH